VTWWRRLIGRGALEADLDRELRDHLERQVADFMRDGVSESEARRRAALMFGGIEGIKESCRDARGTRWFTDLADDVRYSLRVFAHNPAFVAVAVVSLALGIGANTAIFSIVNSLLLRSLPVRDPGQLAILAHGSWTNPIWEQVRERQALFDGAVAFSPDSFDLASGGPADRIEGLWTSGNFFDVMGIPALVGRTYGVEDDRRSGPPNGAVAVLGYSFWQRRFGGAPDVIGRSIAINRVPYTIVGVTPPGFLGPTVGNRFDVAVPIATEPLMRGKESWLDRRSTWWLADQERDRSSRLAEGRSGGLPERPIRSRAGGRRVLQLSRAVSAAAHRRDDHGRAGAAHRLRQHREPDACPCERAPPRDRPPDRARSIATADRAADAHRKPAAVGRRRRARPGAGHVGQRVPRARADDVSRQRDARSDA
jgi:hypothetical protein